MPQSVADWILKTQGLNKHVDPSLPTNPMIRSETVLLGARTQFQDEETLVKAGSKYPSMNDFTAIGLVQSATVQQNKNIQRLWEIASNRLFMIPGRYTVGASLSRTLLDGQSLMRAMYGLEELELGDAGFAGDNSSYIMNLASTFLDKPCDLLFLFFNQVNKPLGGFFLEDAFINQHQMTLSSSNTVVIENIGLLASRIVSLSVS